MPSGWKLSLARHDLVAALFHQVDHIYLGIGWPWTHLNFFLQNPQVSYPLIKPLIMMEQKFKGAPTNAAVGDGASAGLGGNNYNKRTYSPIMRTFFPHESAMTLLSTTQDAIPDRSPIPYRVATTTKLVSVHFHASPSSLSRRTGP